MKKRAEADNLEAEKQGVTREDHVKIAPERGERM